MPGLSGGKTKNPNTHDLLWGGDWGGERLKGGKSMSNSPEQVVAAADVTLPDASRARGQGRARTMPRAPAEDPLR